MSQGCSVYSSIFKTMGHNLNSPKYFEVIKRKYNSAPYIMEIIQPPELLDKTQYKKSMLITYRKQIPQTHDYAKEQKVKEARIKRNKSASIIKRGLSDMMILQQMVKDSKDEKKFKKYKTSLDINNRIKTNKVSSRNCNRLRYDRPLTARANGTEWNITGLHCNNNSIKINNSNKSLDNADSNMMNDDDNDNDDGFKTTKRKSSLAIPIPIAISSDKKPYVLKSRNKSIEMQDDPLKIHHKQPKIILNDLYSQSVLQFLRSANSEIHKRRYFSIKSKVSAIIDEPLIKRKKDYPKGFNMHHSRSCAIIEKDSQYNTNAIAENMLHFNEKNDDLKKRIAALVDDSNVAIRVQDSIKQTGSTTKELERYVKGIRFFKFKEKFHLLSTINPSLAYKQRMKFANDFDLKKGNKIDFELSKWDDDPFDSLGQQKDVK